MRALHVGELGKHRMSAKIYSGNIFTNYSEFTIECDDPDDSRLENGGYSNLANGLVGCSAIGRLFFTAEPKDSLIKLEIELHNNEPLLDNTFDEIVEVPFAKGKENIFLCEWAHEETHLLAIPTGQYRVRYSIKGFDLDYENMDEAEDDEPWPPYPGQRYLIQLWPSLVNESDKILKQSSDLAAYWHNARKSNV